MQGLLLLYCALELDRARIIHPVHTSYLVVTDAVNVDSLVFVKVGASHVPIERNQVRALVIHRLHHIKFIRH